MAVRYTYDTFRHVGSEARDAMALVSSWPLVRRALWTRHFSLDALAGPIRCLATTS